MPLISGTEVHFRGQFKGKGTRVTRLFLSDKWWQCQVLSDRTSVCLITMQCGRWPTGSIQGLFGAVEVKVDDVEHALLCSYNEEARNISEVGVIS